MNSYSQNFVDIFNRISDTFGDPTFKFNIGSAPVEGGIAIGERSYASLRICPMDIDVLLPVKVDPAEDFVGHVILIPSSNGKKLDTSIQLKICLATGRILRDDFKSKEDREGAAKIRACLVSQSIQFINEVF
jgi:hypothetical protein